MFVSEQREHSHGCRLRLLEVQGDAANVDVDPSSRLDAASPGFAHELGCCALVVGDFKQALPLLWLVRSVLLSLPNTLPQALQSTVLHEPLPSVHVRVQFDLIWELEILFGLCFSRLAVCFNLLGLVFR